MPQVFLLGGMFMKVGMVIPSFRPLVGGAERQLEGLLPNLAGLGVSSTVFTRRVLKAPVSGER